MRTKPGALAATTRVIDSEKIQRCTLAIHTRCQYTCQHEVVPFNGICRLEVQGLKVYLTIRSNVWDRIVIFEAFENFVLVESVVDMIDYSKSILPVLTMLQD